MYISVSRPSNAAHSDEKRCFSHRDILNSPVESMDACAELRAIQPRLADLNFSIHTRIVSSDQFDGGVHQPRLMTEVSLLAYRQTLPPTQKSQPGYPSTLVKKKVAIKLLTTRYAIGRPYQSMYPLLGNGKSPIGTVSWNGSVRIPDVDEILHGLKVSLANQPKQFANAYKIAERGVQVHVIGIMNVPERVDEMCMIEMGVYTEHLTPSGSHVTKE